MRYLYMMLSIIPGMGHIALGFCQRGVVFFFFFAFFFNGVFLSSVIWLGPYVKSLLYWGSLAAAVLIWLVNIRDLWHLSLSTMPDRYKAFVRKNLRNAILQYLNGDFKRAKQGFWEVLQKDKINCDAYFYLAVIHQREKDDGRAEKYFRRCLLLDRHNKWTQAIQNLYLHWPEPQ